MKDNDLIKDYPKNYRRRRKQAVVPNAKIPSLKIETDSGTVIIQLSRTGRLLYTLPYGFDAVRIMEFKHQYRRQITNFQNKITKP